MFIGLSIVDAITMGVAIAFIIAMAIVLIECSFIIAETVGFWIVEHTIGKLVDPYGKLYDLLQMFVYTLLFAVCMIAFGICIAKLVCWILL